MEAVAGFVDQPTRSGAGVLTSVAAMNDPFRVANHRVLAVFLLGLSSGCNRPPAAAAELDVAPGDEGGVAPVVAAEPPALERSYLSADGQAQLRERERQGGCDTTCSTKGGAVVWSRAECVVGPGAVAFISADCAKAVVLLTRPSAATAWKDTEVGGFYELGRLRDRYRGAPMLDAKIARQRDGCWRWLAGVEGEPGRPPRYGQDGSYVVFETLNGRATRVPFGATMAEERYENDRVSEPEPARPATGTWSSSTTDYRAPPPRAATRLPVGDTPMQKPVEPAPGGIFGLPRNVSDAVLIHENNRLRGGR